MIASSGSSSNQRSALSGQLVIGQRSKFKFTKVKLDDLKFTGVDLSSGVSGPRRCQTKRNWIRINETEPDLAFIPHFLLPCPNLAPMLPAMQLDLQQPSGGS